MASVNRTVRIDAAMNREMDAMLSELGMSLDEYFMMDMRRTLKEYAALPPSPYLSTPATLEDDLRRAEEARRNGVPFVPIEEVLEELDRIIEEA